MRFNVIAAVFKRNLGSFFTSILGYLFIVAFVVTANWLAFSPRFFTENQPTLDQLSLYFPLLLLFIIPAITMSTWADERKLGTDELLFTLPASDFEILLGKYLSVLAVYTVTLLFVMAQIFALKFLGDPDIGVLLTTYFGYWLAGATLIAAGMLASSLTSNTTVAFVLGVLFCLVLVYAGEVLGAGCELLGLTTVARNVEALSFAEQSRDFSIGLVPLSGLLFFLALTILLLYMNYVVISKRHWASSQKGENMGLQFALRACCIGVTLISVCYLASRAAWSADQTSEQLYTLTPTTSEILQGLDSPVEIEAYVSPEVPEEYVATKKQLEGLLKQFDRVGGSNVRYSRESVSEFSEEAEAASDLGIDSVRVQTERDGRFSEEQVFLGAVVRGKREVVIPFFGKGLPIEYELTRSVRTAAQEERLKVGVLKTDANILTEGNEWRIITELRKQYDIVDVSPTSKIEEGKFNVLLAVMPSSLTQVEMTNFISYVKAGGPTLVFDDPFPRIFSSQMGATMAPKLPKPSPGGGMGGMMGMQRPQAQPKADGGQLTTLQRTLGIRWDNGRGVFDLTEPPSPQFSLIPKQIVFITKSNGNKNAFSSKDPISSGLQNVVALWPGELQVIEGRSDIKVEKLLLTGANSGTLEWEEYIDEMINPFQGMVPVARPKAVKRFTPDEYAHALAVHVTSESKNLNCVFAADIDMIADMFFEDFSQNNMPVKFDNVTFVLNAIDILAGEESYVDLRKRREAQRSLSRVERGKQTFVKELADAETDADEQMEKELKKRKDLLQERVTEIENDKTLDGRAMARQVEAARANQQRRLNVAERNLQLEKDRKIAKSRAAAQRKTRSVENTFRWGAIVIPALPPIFIGLIVLGLRKAREQKDIAQSRRRVR